MINSLLRFNYLSWKYVVYIKALGEVTNTEISDVGLTSLQNYFALQRMVLHPISLMSTSLPFFVDHGYCCLVTDVIWLLTAFGPNVYSICLKQKGSAFQALQLVVVPVCCYSYNFCTKGYFLFISLQLNFESSTVAFICPIHKTYYGGNFLNLKYVWYP